MGEERRVPSCGRGAADTSPQALRLTSAKWGSYNASGWGSKAEAKRFLVPPLGLGAGRRRLTSPAKRQKLQRRC
jgi:hypothetical protein